MNIPRISSYDTAIRIYYEHVEIGNSEITELFGKLSPATISKLKKLVIENMYTKGIISYQKYNVNTRAAYVTWGIDIEDLEQRKSKLEELRLCK